MAESGPLFPVQEPIAAQGTLLVTPRWRSWLRNLRQEVARSAQGVPTVPLLNQQAAIPVTALDNGAQSAGLFSVSWYLAVVVAAGVSSSVQVTIAWVDQGVAKSYSAPALAGNTTTTVQVNEHLLIYSDAGSPITYAIAYASNPAGVMTYSFRPLLQAVSPT